MSIIHQAGPSATQQESRSIQTQCDIKPTEITFLMASCEHSWRDMLTQRDVDDGPRAPYGYNTKEQKMWINYWTIVVRKSTF